jgi:hypothetical protein
MTVAEMIGRCWTRCFALVADHLAYLVVLGHTIKLWC